MEPASALPRGAAIYGVLRPHALRAHFEPPLPWLGALPQWISPLGLSPHRPLWLSMSWGGAPSAIRAGEDVRRIMSLVASGAGADAERLTGWLQRYPRPLAWAHLRLVGRRTSAPDVKALGTAIGGIALMSLDDPLAQWVTTLGTSPASALSLRGRVGAWRQPGTARGPDATYLARLTAFEHPTFLVIRQGSGLTVCDVLVGADPEDDLTEALGMIDSARLGPPAPVKAGRPAGQLWLNLSRFALGARAFGDRQWLRRALALPEGASPPPPSPQRHAEAWLAQSGAEDIFITFDGNGGAARITVDARWRTERTSLALGRAPLPHPSLAEQAPYVLSLASVLEGAGTPLDIDVLRQCSWWCAPAAMGALPETLTGLQSWLLRRLQVQLRLDTQPEKARGYALVAGAVGVASAIALPPQNSSPWGDTPEGLDSGHNDAHSVWWITNRDLLGTLVRQQLARPPAGSDASALRLTLAPGRTESPRLKRLDVEVELTKALGRLVLTLLPRH